MKIVNEVEVHPYIVDDMLHVEVTKIVRYITIIPENYKFNPFSSASLDPGPAMISEHRFFEESDQGFVFNLRELMAKGLVIQIGSKTTERQSIQCVIPSQARPLEILKETTNNEPTDTM